MTATRLRTILCGAALLPACFVDTVPMSTTASTEASSSSSSSSGSISESCPAGELGCECMPGASCSGGLVCEQGTCADRGSCGDGAVDIGEACDDGNTLDSDECVSGCVKASCGDGFVHGGVEACDDGNTVDGDGCNADCEPSGQLNWSVTVDYEGALDVGRSVAIDPSGEIAVAGGGSTENGVDALVARYTPSGELLWSQTFDGAAGGDDVAWAVDFAADGAVVVGGHHTELYDGKADVDGWLARLDATSGEPLWSAYVGGSDAAGTDQIRGVAVDVDGTIAISGFVSNSGSGMDAMVGRYTADGTLSWSNAFDGGGSEDDRFFDLKLGEGGDLVVCGDRSSAEGVDAWIMTVSNNGAILWEQVFGGKGLGSVAPGCASNDSGTVYVTVREHDGDAVTHWLLIYNARGEMTLSQSFGEGGGVEYGQAIVPGNDGDLVLVGAESAVGEGTNLMVRKHKSSATLAWDLSIAGAGMFDDVGYDVAIGPSGEIVVTGVVAKTLPTDGALWLGRITP